MKRRSWDSVSYEFKKEIVELGGLFFTQKELAKKLKVPPGTIASFRLRHGVSMSAHKVGRYGPEFAQFLNMLGVYVQAKKTPAKPQFLRPVESTRLMKTTSTPTTLRVIVNPDPPLDPDEIDEKKLDKLVALITGGWEPHGADRPFLKLPKPEQRRIQYVAERVLDRREQRKKDLRL